MLDINQFPNVSELKDIESNFRVFAGPGAGKTTWLVDHLQKILKTSARLNKTKKIACITYTNVAAEEVINKLSCDKSRFDISTIHSFLYRNIVRPFSHLIANDDNGDPLFNINDLDGHVEHIPHRDMIRRWRETIEKLNKKKYGYFNDPKKKTDLYAMLSSIDYSFVDGNPDLIFRRYRSIPVPTKEGELWLYKKKYWHDGIMHHEDVLFFSFMIINRSPRTLEFVRNRFPYILIDEFQDTTELQTWAIRKIAESETKIGVIGDLAQSIYKFAGAVRKDFENFQLENLRSYKLENNHRSTKKIINFLNCLRYDICQKEAQCTVEGCNVKLLVGPILKAMKWLEDNGFENTYTLTRKNETVEEIDSRTTLKTEDYLRGLYGADSNSVRIMVLHSILMGYKFYEKGYFRDAIREVLKPLKHKAEKSIRKLELRNTAIDIIDDLKRDETRQQSLYDYYDRLLDGVKRKDKKHNFQIGPRLTNRSSAKGFYEATKVSDLLKFIKVDTRSEDTVRTIHSAKGTEFKNVMVHFEKLKDFEKYVFTAYTCLDADEDDARIYYVGFSRAIECLFINIPEIGSDTLTHLREINVDYEILV